MAATSASSRVHTLVKSIRDAKLTSRRIGRRDIDSHEL